MSDIICISHLRWDFVWQRPQHLLSRLARHHRILFVEEPMTNTEITAPVLEVLPAKGAKQVTVIRLHQPATENRWIGHGDPLTQETYARLLNDYLEKTVYSDCILWLYTPMASEFIETVKPTLLIVDVMDQLSAFKGAPAELVQREVETLRRADMVFTGGASLYRDKLAFNQHTHLFPSGVEIEHFATAADPNAYETPHELVGLPRPIVGYYGVIDERMDLENLAYLARAKPEWSIVMVGPVVKIDPAELPQAPNLHYVGMKTYEELPAYLAHFDLAMVPFALSEATRFLSPTKTLEYMAAHKPIVSTPINDVVELYGEVVHIAHTPEAFVSQAETALTEDKSKRLEAENRLLEQNTWNSIAARMESLIQNALEEQTTNKPKHEAA